YCFSDCDGAAALYQERQDKVPPQLMAHWTEYMLAVAGMERRGIPFDLHTWGRIMAVRRDLIRVQADKVNRTWPVYDGTVFKKGKFLEWTKRVGIEWPTKRSPTTRKVIPDMEDDAFKIMEARHPFVKELRQAKKTILA